MANFRIPAKIIAVTMLVVASVGTTTAEEPIRKTTPQFGTWGIDLTARDPSVKPGTDFYLYANGDWLKRAKLPPDRPVNDQFSRLDDLAQMAMRQLVEDAAAGHSSDHDAGRVAAAYHAFMDEARVEALDAQPLAADLARIRGEKTKAEVAMLMGTSPYHMQQSIFGLEITADDKAPDHYAVWLRTLGSGLPDRDYYLKPEFAEAKARYQAYVATMLGMIGWAEPEANARAIVELETKLAQARWTRAEARDPDKAYSPMTVAQLDAYAPGFGFAGFLASAKLGGLDRVIVKTNTAFPEYAAIFAATPLDTLKAWQAFHLGNGAAGYLSKRFVDAKFQFYRTLTGQAEIEPRWKRAVQFVDGVLPHAIGRMYVARHFPPRAKAQMEALVKRVLAAMRARIEHATWMSADTKQKAFAKLDTMTIRIGYPAKWRSYDTLEMRPDDLYGDAVRSEAFAWDYRVERLDKPVDRAEWNLDAQDANAEYDPTLNSLTFPAAILQPPFFDPDADMAVNYGAIGAIIGHEITHGFDDEGRKYGADGKLADWWAPQDAAAFKSRTDRLGAQFDKFEPVKGQFVNGQLTMGENIADLGGLLVALDAYHAALGGESAPVLDGLTGDQRLFLSWAQVYRSKMAEPYAIMLLKSDPHSPSQFRVDGPVRNIDAWYKAFNVGPNEPMYLAPQDRVSIW
jgi:putative endopeptidase